MTVLERTIQAYTKDAGDDVVWSNWAYPLAALGAQSLTAAVTVALTGAAPVAYAFYWLVETDSQIHVPAWSAVALAIVAVKAGWWALVPGLLFVAAGTLQLTTGTDSRLHSLWHVLGAAAAGTALYLV